MLNNAWPSLIWNLYDYYLRPAGAYFGTKKACEPIHVQYSYDDRSVYVVNSLFREFKSLKTRAEILDMNLKERFSREVTLDFPPDSSMRILDIPELRELTTTYFVRLLLTDIAGKLVSTNFYWLSTKPDVLDWEKSVWYYTPTRSLGDLTELKQLPGVKLKVESSTEQRGTEKITRVVVENPARQLAFFIRLQLRNGRGGEEVLPILWQDNYFSLMPGERREVTATYRSRDLQEATPVVEADGWNVTKGPSF
jgi:exo-1,4-beta-D-glucosaminidase